MAMSQTNLPPKKNGAELMRELRLKILTTPPSEMGVKPSKDFPHVTVALMDWPLGTNVISVYGACTGDASIYSTSTFGVIGGIGHETVRHAASQFVKVAESHYHDSVIVKEYPYPKPGRIYFYFVSYEDVRMIDADEKSLNGGADKYSDLSDAAQRLVTELRKVVEIK
jgi:hypothetical protein